jgi:hypothetical protein
MLLRLAVIQSVNGAKEYRLILKHHLIYAELAR